MNSEEASTTDFPYHGDNSFPELSKGTNSSETTEPHRLKLPVVMNDAKSNLQCFLQRKGKPLPTYENKSFGESHILRWSSTVRFENGSSVSISPILKSKKDSDKAVAFKALQIGLQRLQDSVVVIHEDLVEDVKMINQLLANEETMADFHGKPTNGQSTANGNIDEYGMVLSRTIDNTGSKDSSGMVKLPFTFPMGISDSTDVVSIVASECMRSATRRRQVIGFGTEEQWLEGWKRLVTCCLSNNGVVVASSPEILTAILESLNNMKDVPQYDVCSALGNEPAFPIPCIIENSILSNVNMHVLFPIERPILIVDNSPNWSVTWKWMAYLPTFHIAGFCYAEDNDMPLIQLYRLRDVFNADLYFMS